MTMAIHQILGIRWWHKQEERKSWNKAFSLSLAWRISSWHMLSGPGALLALSCWRAEYSSLIVKSPERSRSTTH